MKDPLNSTVGTDSYPVTLVPPRAQVESAVSLALFFQYGLGAFSVYYWAQFPWEVYPGLSKAFESYGLEFNLPNACQLLLLGGMGLYLGARLSGHRIGNWLPSLRWQIDHSKFNHNLTLYTPIALLFFVVLQWYVPEAIRFVFLLFICLFWVLLLIVCY